MKQPKQKLVSLTAPLACPYFDNANANRLAVQLKDGGIYSDMVCALLAAFITAVCFMPNIACRLSLVELLLACRLSLVACCLLLVTCCLLLVAC